MYQFLERYYTKVDGDDPAPSGPGFTEDELERRGFHRFVDVHPILFEYQLAICNQPDLCLASAMTAPPRCLPPSLDDLADEVDEVISHDLIQMVREQLHGQADQCFFRLRMHKRKKNVHKRKKNVPQRQVKHRT